MYGLGISKPSAKYKIDLTGSPSWAPKGNLYGSHYVILPPVGPGLSSTRVLPPGAVRGIWRALGAVKYTASPNLTFNSFHTCGVGGAYKKYEGIIKGIVLTSCTYVEINGLGELYCQ